MYKWYTQSSHVTGGDTRRNRGENDGEDREQGIAGSYAPVPDSGAMPSKGEDTFEGSGNPLPDREAGCVSDATRMPLRSSSMTGCWTPSPLVRRIDTRSCG